MGVSVKYLLRREAYKIVEGSLRANKALKVQDIFPFCIGVQVEVSSNVFYDIPIEYSDCWFEKYPEVAIAWASGELGIISERQKEFITNGVSASFKTVKSNEDSAKLLSLVNSIREEV